MNLEHVSLPDSEVPSRNIASESLVRVKRAVRKPRFNNAVPDYVLNDAALNAAIAYLPENYNFEVHKCIWKIKSENVSTVALQFPEGLLMYACVISDIIVRFTGSKVIILGDVTYGACCIDDFTAQKLGAELLIHYGHSCLVPINTTKIKVHLRFKFLTCCYHIIVYIVVFGIWYVGSLCLR
jgi:2-(3-amino-3-carboxypropyl)histidine synthase